MSGKEDIYMLWSLAERAARSWVAESAMYLYMHAPKFSNGVLAMTLVFFVVFFYWNDDFFYSTIAPLRATKCFAVDNTSDVNMFSTPYIRWWNEKLNNQKFLSQLKLTSAAS